MQSLSTLLCWPNKFHKAQDSCICSVLCASHCMSHNHPRPGGSQHLQPCPLMTCCLPVSVAKDCNAHFADADANQAKQVQKQLCYLEQEVESTRQQPWVTPYALNGVGLPSSRDAVSHKDCCCLLLLDQMPHLHISQEGFKCCASVYQVACWGCVVRLLQASGPERATAVMLSSCHESHLLMLVFCAVLQGSVQWCYSALTWAMSCAMSRDDLVAES